MFFIFCFHLRCDMRKHFPRSVLNNSSVAEFYIYMQTYVFLPTSARKVWLGKWDVCLAKEYSRPASARRGTVGLREAGKGRAKIVCSYKFLARVRVIKPQRWDIFLCLRLTRNAHTHVHVHTRTYRYKCIWYLIAHVHRNAAWWPEKTREGRESG